MTKTEPCAPPPHESPPAGEASSQASPTLAKSQPLASEALFAGRLEVQIVHRGTLYRLKRTALGKLILTK